MTSSPRATTKGVGFSDRLEVLGAHSISSVENFQQTSLINSNSTIPLPKAPVFVKRGENAIQKQQQDTPDVTTNRTISSYFEHTVVDDYESESGTTPPPPPNFCPPQIAHPISNEGSEVEEEDGVSEVNIQNQQQEEEEEETVEQIQPITCCSSNAVIVELPPEDAFEKSTRINTKLNSLPSGGAFSLMNSSEDVNSSSQARSLSSSDDGKRANRSVSYQQSEIVEDESETETETDSETSSSDDDDLRSPRRMVRVDGSAKLSSASGLNAEDFDSDDSDEFGIEGAEHVDEEEAVQVRSFGRAFAKVCLKDGTEDKIIPDPRRNDSCKNTNDANTDGRNVVAFADDSTLEKKLSGENIIAVGTASAISKSDINEMVEKPKSIDRQRFLESKSTPPRRKSRLRITFTRRSSAAMRRLSGGGGGGGSGNEENGGNGSKNMGRTNMSALGCFPNRKTMLSRTKKGLDSRTGALSTCDPGIVIPSTETSDQKRTYNNRNASKPPRGRFTNIPPASPPPEITQAAQESAKRKIVKNISLQRDDWIDFATNAAQRQRQPWLIRLVSSSGNESSTSGGRNGGLASGDTSTASTDGIRSGRRRWKLWKRE